MQDIETQVRANLAELDRRYIRLQMKAGMTHGLIIGLTIYIILRRWGIV